MVQTRRHDTDGHSPASAPTLGSREPGTPANPPETIEQSLDRIEVHLKGLEVFLVRILGTVTATATVKESYTTNEVAVILNRRPYTVREWCRLGRVKASRAHAGRGEVEEWRISHQELLRGQNEGLLPHKLR